jgi:ribosomal protein S18 acetylase RimI-like enzyme
VSQSPELIYCASGGRWAAEIAIAHGYTYGAQLPGATPFPPEFADQDWKRPDFDAYLCALETHRPRMATVLDWEHEDQLPEVLRWAEAAARFVTETVIIIPKVTGGIGQLPRTIGGCEVRLGYSVPTKFGATPIPSWEFAGWPVHLLGGPPHRQHNLAQYMDVRSVDGNYANKMAVRWVQAYSAMRLDYVEDARWPRLREVYENVEQDAPAAAWELSCINIRAMWLDAPTFIRWGLEKDLPAIKRIAARYHDELGFVMLPSLREAVARRSLYVATDSAGNVQGFANTRKRRDGVTVIYEIAVAPEWRGKRIGAALLAGVPSPKRLKVTQDNEAAIAFYEGAGMQRVAAESGRRRSLYVYESHAIRPDSVLESGRMLTAVGG